MRVFLCPCGRPPFRGNARASLAARLRWELRRGALERKRNVSKAEARAILRMPSSRMRDHETWAILRMPSASVGFRRIFFVCFSAGQFDREARTACRRSKAMAGALQEKRSFSKAEAPGSLRTATKHPAYSSRQRHLCTGVCTRLPLRKTRSCAGQALDLQDWVGGTGSGPLMMRHQEEQSLSVALPRYARSCAGQGFLWGRKPSDGLAGSVRTGLRGWGGGIR
ncbi:MAG: hypothetical protein JWR26_3582 [Pedosphaera sp.]|nr:hypothetical protein [Pedosphaera sp.]